jgi:hypothetical protein
MKENIKKHITFENLREHLSIHNLGMFIIAVVAVSVAWSSTKIIQRNYKLMKQITVLEQKVQLEKIQIENQKLMNDYYKTDTYLEIAARRQFNKALPGEKLMLVSRTLALQKVPGIAKDESSQEAKSNNLSNWQQWVRFLSGRAIGD